MNRTATGTGVLSPAGRTRIADSRASTPVLLTPVPRRPHQTLALAKDVWDAWLSTAEPGESRLPAGFPPASAPPSPPRPASDDESDSDELPTIPPVSAPALKSVASLQSEFEQATALNVVLTERPRLGRDENPTRVWPACRISPRHRQCPAIAAGQRG